MMRTLFRLNSLKEQTLGSAQFFRGASFRSAKFSGEANFSDVLTKDLVFFRHVLFEDGKKNSVWD